MHGMRTTTKKLAMLGLVLAIGYGDTWSATPRRPTDTPHATSHGDGHGHQGDGHGHSNHGHRHIGDGHTHSDHGHNEPGSLPPVRILQRVVGSVALAGIVVGVVLNFSSVLSTGKRAPGAALGLIHEGVHQLDSPRAYILAATFSALSVINRERQGRYPVRPLMRRAVKRTLKVSAVFAILTLAFEQSLHGPEEIWNMARSQGSTPMQVAVASGLLLALYSDHISARLRKKLSSIRLRTRPPVEQ